MRLMKNTNGRNKPIEGYQRLSGKEQGTRNEHILKLDNQGLSQRVIGLRVGLSHVRVSTILKELREKGAKVKVSLVMNLGPRLIRIEGKVVGTIDGLTAEIAEATPEELAKLNKAEVIELVKSK